MSAVLGIRLIVAVMLAVLAIEAIAIHFAGRDGRRVPPLGAMLPNLGAGLFLVLALGSTTLAEPLLPVASCVLLAGLSHACDLIVRVRRHPR